MFLIHRVFRGLCISPQARVATDVAVRLPFAPSATPTRKLHSALRLQFRYQKDVSANFHSKKVSQFHGGAGARYQRYQDPYQRFQTRSGNTIFFIRKWSRRSTFYYEVGGLALLVGSFYTMNLEQVPESGRRRFNCISPAQEEQMGKQQYEQVIQQYGRNILPEKDSRTQQVKRIVERLLPQSGLADEGNWKVHVIESEEANAFVIPGGNVFVFSGLLHIANDEEKLAAVLGHEIAHNVAHHFSERMSRVFILVGLVYVLELFVGVPGGLSQAVLNLGFDKPGSRREESEADYIGLLMLARSCYNPEAAPEMWERMEEAQKGQGQPPQMLSTHPSNHNREAKLREWLPQAYEEFEKSNCGTISRHLNNFRQTTREW